MLINFIGKRPSSFQNHASQLKIKSGSYLNLFNYFLDFRPLVSNTKKSNMGHDINLYTFSFILVKTEKSIWNNFYDIFIQISGEHKK